MRRFEKLGRWWRLRQSGKCVNDKVVDELYSIVRSTKDKRCRRVQNWIVRLTLMVFMTRPRVAGSIFRSFVKQLLMHPCSCAGAGPAPTGGGNRWYKRSNLLG
eukprot:1380549-Amorphochlora_amoeboformis.AAC.2